MRIGICDDEQVYLDKIAEFCREYEKINDKTCEIILYHSGRELLESGKWPDVVFLDIQMEDMNGLETGQKLRREKAQKCLVVYITAYQEYAESAYDTNVIGFLVKPVTYDMVERMIHRAEQRKEEYQIVFEEGDQEIMVHDILWVQASTPYVSIQLVSGKSILKRTGLTEMEQQLKNRGFFRVHDAYLVNMAYIWKVSQNKITIQEMEIPVSRRKYSLFKKAYEIYKEKHNGR